MGLPAIDMRRHGVPVRPRLRVVSGPVAAARPRNIGSARKDQRCREAFSLACVVMIGLALFGVGRVMLSARAAETAMESSRIQSDIKAQRLAGDLLEVDKSALATPSRIEGIAGQTLKMAVAPSIDYMTLPTDSGSASADLTAPVDDVGPATKVSSAEVGAVTVGGLAGMLASVMEMAAGEAEILLVGDAGLASAR